MSDYIMQKIGDYERQLLAIEKKINELSMQRSEISAVLEALRDIHMNLKQDKVSVSVKDSGLTSLPQGKGKLFSLIYKILKEATSELTVLEIKERADSIVGREVADSSIRWTLKENEAFFRKVDRGIFRLK